MPTQWQEGVKNINTNLCIGPNSRWWDDEIYEYGLKGLTDEIIEIKEKRLHDKVLSDESYDFVVYFNQLI